MYVIRLLDLEMIVDAMTEVSATDKEKADLLNKVRSVIQIACEDKSAKSRKAKSLDLEIPIQELTHNRDNDDSLEPPEARPKVSWQS